MRLTTLDCINLTCCNPSVLNVKWRWRRSTISRASLQPFTNQMSLQCAPMQEALK